MVIYMIVFFSMLAIICLYLLIQLDKSSKAVYSRAGEQEIRQLDLDNIFNQKRNGKSHLFGTSK